VKQGERDLLERAQHGDLRDYIGRPVEERATVSVGPEDTLLVAYGRFKLNDVSQLPVLEGERIVGRNPPLDIIARDIIFGEGPVWDNRAKQLYFTDIIGDTIWKWKPGVGQEVVLRPSVKANGTALDLERRLVVAGWGGRTVFRQEKDGSWKTLADRWQGKKLNTPNDIVVKSDGSIWFTDPPGGMYNVGMVGPDVQRYLETQPVFRIAPDGALSAVCEDNVYPNGLCFSPDEKILYVVESRGVPNRKILAYDVTDGGTRLANRRILIDAGPGGTPDGMRCDIDGNLWCGWGMGSAELDGVLVFNPDGKPIGRIALPERCANVCFGGPKRNRLFMAAAQSVYALYVNTQGALGG